MGLTKVETQIRTFQVKKTPVEIHNLLTSKISEKKAEEIIILAQEEAEDLKKEMHEEAIALKEKSAQEGFDEGLIAGRNLLLDLTARLGLVYPNGESLQIVAEHLGCESVDRFPVVGVEAYEALEHDEELSVALGIVGGPPSSAAAKSSASVARVDRSGPIERPSTRGL